jgi:hypothetical protein
MGNLGKWNLQYEGLIEQEPYGDLRTYELGAEFLKDCDLIEDWGCGKGWFRRYFPPGRYRGIDGSRTPFADEIVDLTRYRSRVEGIFLRHVLEHDWEWKQILRNALASFTTKLVLVIYTPFSDDVTRQIDYSDEMGIPVISFRYGELIQNLEGLNWYVHKLETATDYKSESVFYVEKPAPSSPRCRPGAKP